MNENKQQKKRTVSLTTYILSLIGTVVIVCFLTFIGTTVGVLSLTNRNQNELSQVEDLYTKIVQNYAGKINQTQLIEGALKGMTNALDDPYSEYLDKEETENLNSSISGEFEGIGASVGQEEDQPVIAEPPIKGSPAEKAGLKANDLILKVDGEATKGKKLNEVVNKIRGKKGTQVKLTIQREGETFDVTITRDTIPIDSVFSELDKSHPEIGVIHITTFGETTFKETKNAIEELRKKGATSFIFDVRQNPGGLLTAVEDISSMFLEDGQTIVQFEDKNGEKTTHLASKELDNGFKVNEPVVVLVDKNSASASEIFAAALKESADIPVIGTNTFGKGTVQSVLPLSNDSEVKLTISKWLTPNGEWIHKKGLKPTIEADYPSYAYLHPIDKETELKIGDVNSSVKTAKEMLQAVGENPGPVNEIYDEELSTAVKAFQQSKQLSETSTLNKETIVTLEQTVQNLVKENDLAYQKAVEELIK